MDRDCRLPQADNENGVAVCRLKLKAPYGSKMILMMPLWWTYIGLFLSFHNFDILSLKLDNLYLY